MYHRNGFFVDCNGEVKYLGESSDDSDPKVKFDELLCYNPQIQPDKNAEIWTYSTYDCKAKTKIITYWLSAKEFSHSDIDYLGYNPEHDMHCWRTYVGAYFVDPLINLVALYNEKKITSEGIVRFVMVVEEIWLPPVVYGYTTPGDSNLLEISNGFMAFTYKLTNDGFEFLN